MNVMCVQVCQCRRRTHTRTAMRSTPMSKTAKLKRRIIILLNIIIKINNNLTLRLVLIHVAP